MFLELKSTPAKIQINNRNSTGDLIDKTTHALHSLTKQWLCGVAQPLPTCKRPALLQQKLSTDSIKVFPYA